MARFLLMDYLRYCIFIGFIVSLRLKNGGIKLCSSFQVIPHYSVVSKSKFFNFRHSTVFQRQQQYTVRDLGKNKRKIVLNASSSITLDNPILPKAGFDFVAMILIAIGIAVGNYLIQVFLDVRKKETTRAGNDESDREWNSSVTKYIKDFKSFLIDSISNFRDEAMKLFSNLRFSKVKENSLSETQLIELGDWSVCTLKKRDVINNGKFCRYRLGFEDSQAQIPSFIGQEVLYLFIIVSVKERTILIFLLVFILFFSYFYARLMQTIKP